MPAKGQATSEETKRKLSVAMTGRTFSDETKRKMSIAKHGKPSLPMHRRWHVNRGLTSPKCYFCSQIES